MVDDCKSKYNMAEEYVVEAILGEKRAKQRNGKTKVLYQVKWAGYDDITWEPASHLMNCKGKLQEYLRKKRKIQRQVNEHNEGKQEESENEERENDGVAEVQEEDEEEEDGEEDEEEEDGKESDKEEDGEESNKEEDEDDKASFLNSDASGDEDEQLENEDPDIFVEETGYEEVDELDEEELNAFHDIIAGNNAELRSDLLNKMAISGYTSPFYGEDSTKAYLPTNHYEGTPTLSNEAFIVASSMAPIDLFFYFMPKDMWRMIARETNRYEKQTRNERIRLAKVRLLQKFPRDVAKHKLAEQKQQILSFQEVLPHEILVMMGLLIARSLCPMKMGLEHHWGSMQKGAVPSGTWSRYMTRQRFRNVSRFLHFSDNNHPMAKRDRAWKIRPVVEILQRTFMKGMTMGKWVAFDEMVIPSKSSRNAIRIYLKNKPHKFGTKLFAVCCGETSYCARIEVYCGSRQDSKVMDNMCGPAAVIRNLQAIWPTSKIDKSRMRVVITDREYTSVSLAVRLYRMGFCSIGTVQTSRLGFPKAIKYPFKKIPKRMESQRGLCRLRRSIDFPDLFTCRWLDSKPVYFIACGVSTQKTSVVRKEKSSGVSSTVSCPDFVASYNKYMNGVTGFSVTLAQTVML